MSDLNKKLVPKFHLRADEYYYEFNLTFAGKAIKSFKKAYFRANSKHDARIYCKAFFPPDCPEKLWMYYLVFEINKLPHDITSITKEAFDVLTRGIEPEEFQSVEFYTLEKFASHTRGGNQTNEKVLDELANKKYHQLIDELNLTIAEYGITYAEIERATGYSRLTISRTLQKKSMPYFQHYLTIYTYLKLQEKANLTPGE